MFFGILAFNFFLFCPTIPCMHNYTMSVLLMTYIRYNSTLYNILFGITIAVPILLISIPTMQECPEKEITHVQGFCMNWRGLYFYAIDSLHVQPQSCTMRSCSQSSGSCSVQFLRSAKNTDLSDSAARPNSLFSVSTRAIYFSLSKKKNRCRSQRPWNSSTTDPCRIWSEADVEAETRASTDVARAGYIVHNERYVSLVGSDTPYQFSAVVPNILPRSANYVGNDWNILCGRV